MFINNLPTIVRNYIVYREADNENWYWCSFDKVDKAVEVAKEIDGKVCSKYEVEE